METDKQRRHEHTHQPGRAHDEPASTDLADAIRDQKAADAASAHQRRHAGAQPAGDARHGAGAGTDIHGRFTNVRVDGGHTWIDIALGAEQGIHHGMQGYIKAGDGLLAEFSIEWADARMSTARVDLAPEAVHGSSEVVVNPSSKPPPRKDIHGRIIGHSVEGGGRFARLLIGLGATSGVRLGMNGFMHAGDGLPVVAFAIAEVTARTCSAVVELPNQDLPKQCPQVVLNPTSGASAAKSHAAPHHHA